MYERFFILIEILDTGCCRRIAGKGGSSHDSVKKLDAVQLLYIRPCLQRFFSTIASNR